GHLAAHHFTARHWAELQQEADAAWRLSRGINDPEVRFLGSLGQLLARWCEPDRDTSRMVLDECTWSAEASSDPSSQIRGRYFRARPLIEFADRDGFTAAIQLVEEGVNGHVPAYSRWVSATWRTLEAIVDGELERAGELMDRSARLGQGHSQIARGGRFH